jgi:hypothetical protein
VNDADNQRAGVAPQDAEAGPATGLERRGPDEEPDLLLDVSELRVDEISLEVDDLRAQVSLQADVLDLLKLHVGVEAELGRVQLTIKGVEAKLLLKVRLDNVARILDRVLTTIDKNPGIVERLTERVGATAEDVATDAREAVGELGAGAASAADDVGDAARTSVGEVTERPLDAPLRQKRTDTRGKRSSKRSRERRSQESG